MKNLSILFLIINLNIQAQVNLMGMSTNDGPNGNGFIYKLQNGNLQHVYDFMSTDNNGKYPIDGLVEFNGLYYGVTTEGGTNNTGTLFTYNYTTNTITVVHNFDKNKGFNPGSNLCLYNNKFYGYYMFNKLGQCRGTFYEFDPSTSSFRTLYEITDPNEGTCATNIIIKNNILYGTFLHGGTNGNGTLFSLDLASLAYTVLHNFDNSEGKSVFANPVFYNNALYGITTSGYPPNNNMYIYKYNLSNDVFEIINDFSSVSLGYGAGGHIVLDNGIIYGTTNDTGNYTGHIYQYDIDTNQLTSLYDITDNMTAILRGFVKYGDILYGLTGYHILYGNHPGEVFSYNLSTGIFQYHFAFQEGTAEYNYITKIDNNKIIGLRRFGGKVAGEIFEADLNNNTYQTKYKFNTAPLGGEPYKQIIRANNGKYYGITNEGGNYGYGVVFEMDNNGNLDAIHHFQTFSHENLMLSGDKLYFSDKYIFKSIDINTHQINIEANLGFTTKSYTQASNGKIYIFPYYSGYVYEFDPLTGDLNQLTNTNGYQYIKYGLTEYDGKLYFVADMNYQANNFMAGFLLSFDLATHQIELIKEFDDTSGTTLYADNLSLTILNNKIYGHTTRGGVNNYGTLFEYNPTNNTFRVILDLTNKNVKGQKLLPIGNHILLGTFEDKILSFDIQTGLQSVIYDLSNDNIYSSYASLLDIGTTAIEKEILTHFNIYPNPMIDVLHIKNKDSFYKVTNAKIYDISGKEIINTPHLSYINVSNLRKGIYILQLQIANGDIAQQLILKN